MSASTNGFDPKHRSRALTEGLSVDQTDAEFDATLDSSIAAIYAASST